MYSYVLYDVNAENQIWVLWKAACSLSPWAIFSDTHWTFKSRILKSFLLVFQLCSFQLFKLFWNYENFEEAYFPSLSWLLGCVCILPIVFILHFLNSHVCFILCETTLCVVLTCAHALYYYRKDIRWNQDTCLTSLVLGCSYRCWWTFIIPIMRFRNRGWGYSSDEHNSKIWKDECISLFEIKK